MQMVKIKLFDTNITFKDYPRLSLSLWNNTDFYVIVQDVDQPAFAQILSPSPLSPLPSPTTILHSVAAQTVKIKQLIIS